MSDASTPKHLVGDERWSQLTIVVGEQGYYAAYVRSALEALTGDGALIHERNKYLGVITGYEAIIQRDYALDRYNDCKVQVDRFWRVLDEAVGWMTRIAERGTP